MLVRLPSPRRAEHAEHPCADPHSVFGPGPGPGRARARRGHAQTLVQYGNQARLWSANARFGWLGTAGNGLYVVFNEGQAASGFFQWDRPQTRSLIVKYSRQLGRIG